MFLAIKRHLRAGLQATAVRYSFVCPHISSVTNGGLGSKKGSHAGAGAEIGAAGLKIESPRRRSLRQNTVKSAISWPVVRTYVVVADLSFET